MGGMVGESLSNTIAIKERVLHIGKGILSLSTLSTF